jgi:hypothetical protein
MVVPLESIPRPGILGKLAGAFPAKVAGLGRSGKREGE